MSKSVKYGTLLLLIVFLNTIGFSGYAQANNLSTRAKNCSISERRDASECVQIFYNLCAETPKQMDIDKQSVDLGIIFSTRTIMELWNQFVSIDKICVEVNSMQLSLLQIKSNLYYIFALRKISV